MKNMMWQGQLNSLSIKPVVREHDYQGFYFPLFQTDIRNSSYNRQRRYGTT